LNACITWNSFTSINSSLCSKVYDIVDWHFLNSSMQKMAFCHRWVQWIMVCVTAVKYSVKFNWILLEIFSPSRGLWLFSVPFYLFICSKMSIYYSKKFGGIRWTQIEFHQSRCVKDPRGSLAYFCVDDSLLFFGATEEQAIFCEECIGYLCFLYREIDESINVVYLV
jgi:hypothetical protein